jgi:hypothetical protein
MASIHITEIQRYLANKGAKDALVDQSYKEGFFLELRFDDPASRPSGVVDEEFKDRAITVDCPYGTVTILFDSEGLLKSLELC